MFDTGSQSVIMLRPINSIDDNLSDPDQLRQRCLEPAELWVLKRRASRPYRAPQRLPQVARVS